MGCFVLVRCVLVLRCGLAGVVWYACWSTSASACIWIPPQSNTIKKYKYYTYEETNSKKQINDQTTFKNNAIFRALSHLNQWATSNQTPLISRNSSVSTWYKLYLHLNIIRLNKASPFYLGIHILYTIWTTRIYISSIVINTWLFLLWFQILYLEK